MADGKSFDLDTSAPGILKSLDIPSGARPEVQDRKAHFSSCTKSFPRVISSACSIGQGKPQLPKRVHQSGLPFPAERLDEKIGVLRRIGEAQQNRSRFADEKIPNADAQGKRRGVPPLGGSQTRPIAEPVRKVGARTNDSDSLPWCRTSAIRFVIQYWLVSVDEGVAETCLERAARGGLKLLPPIGRWRGPMLRREPFPSSEIYAQARESCRGASASGDCLFTRLALLSLAVNNLAFQLAPTVLIADANESASFSRPSQPGGSGHRRWCFSFTTN